MHIHITFMTYHLYMLIACQSLSVHVLCLWHIFYLYFYCIPVSILYIFLYFSSFIFMTYHILCTITYIISYHVSISCFLLYSGYMPMLYFSFFIFILVLSYTFILYAFILYFSYTVILYYSYTSYTFVRSYSIIYFILSYTFCTFLVLV